MTVRRLVALLLLVLLAGRPPAAAQSLQTVDTFTIRGAPGLILIPENWNGGLFIYAHGYSADARLQEPFPPDITLSNIGSKVNPLLLAVLLPALTGYASATTAYRSAGWAVEDAVKDIASRVVARTPR